MRQPVRVASRRPRADNAVRPTPDQFQDQPQVPLIPDYRCNSFSIARRAWKRSNVKWHRLMTAIRIKTDARKKMTRPGGTTGRDGYGPGGMRRPCRTPLERAL